MSHDLDVIAFRMGRFHEHEISTTIIKCHSRSLFIIKIEKTLNECVYVFVFLFQITTLNLNEYFIYQEICSLKNVYI